MTVEGREQGVWNVLRKAVLVGMAGVEAARTYPRANLKPGAPRRAKAHASMGSQRQKDTPLTRGASGHDGPVRAVLMKRVSSKRVVSYGS